MKPPVAVLMLGLGALLATAFGLYDGDLASVRVLAVAGFALVVVGASGLASAFADQRSATGASVADGFRFARTGAVVGVALAGLALAGVDRPALSLVGIGALAAILWGGTRGLLSALPEGWRAAAAGRLGRVAILVLAPLALLTVLDMAGTGPEWTSAAATGFRIAAIVLAAWFAAFCAAQRDAVATQPAA